MYADDFDAGAEAEATARARWKDGQWIQLAGSDHDEEPMTFVTDDALALAPALPVPTPRESVRGCVRPGTRLFGVRAA